MPRSSRPLRIAALAALLLPFVAEAKGTDSAEKSFLWKVTGKTGRVVHLFGSVHMADESVYPLAPAVEKAFADSQVLAVEADIENADPMKVMQLTMAKAALGDGRTLSQVVSKETWAGVEKATEGLLPAASLEPFQPWFAAMTIASSAIKKSGLDPEMGLDRHFLRKKGARKVVELEGMEFQINLFASFPLEQQEQLLAWTLADVESVGKEVKKLIDAWKRGDLGVTEQLLNEGLRQTPEARPVIDALIHERNATMTKKVEAMLQTDEREFVVVGAAHLVGESGLVHQLRKKGYRVEQL